ncbi:MAG: hypothetical protein ACLFVS_07540 [Candidatus Acetothermia bacterium]
MDTTNRLHFFVSIALILSIGFVLVGTQALGGDKERDVIERGGIGVALLNLTDLNSSLEDEGYKSFDGTVLVTSGGGHLNVTDNLRIGGIGYQGSTDTSFTDGNGDLAIKFGGLLLEGKFGLTDSLSFLAGGLAGMGTLDLKINESIPETFSGALTDTPNTHHLTKNYFGIQPSLVIELAIFPWLSLRANASYLWGPGEGWDLAGQKISGPLSHVSAPIFCLSFHLGGTGANEGEDV